MINSLPCAKLLNIMHKSYRFSSDLIDNYLTNINMVILVSVGVITSFIVICMIAAFF